MLVTLRLYLSDGRRRQLSYEVDEDDARDARDILEATSEGGFVRLGDRESCPLDAVERVEFAPPPAARSGPEWIEAGKPPDATLRDEDVSTAIREQPEGERPDVGR